MHFTKLNFCLQDALTSFFESQKDNTRDIVNVSLQNAQEKNMWYMFSADVVVFGENVRIYRLYIIHISQNPDRRQELTDNLFSQVLEYFSQVLLKS